MKYLLIVLLVVLAGCEDNYYDSKDYWRGMAGSRGWEISRLQDELYRLEGRMTLESAIMRSGKFVYTYDSGEIADSFFICYDWEINDVLTQWDTLWVDSIPYIQTVRLDTFLINADIHHSDYGKSFRKQEIK